VLGTRLTPLEVAGRIVLVGRLIGGDVVAVSRICPHRHLPMDGGSCLLDEVACPNHQYTYDARTGENRYPKNVFPAAKARQLEGVTVYPTREEDGWIWIAVEPEP